MFNTSEFRYFSRNAPSRHAHENEHCGPGAPLILPIQGAGRFSVTGRTIPTPRSFVDNFLASFRTPASSVIAVAEIPNVHPLSVDDERHLTWWSTTCDSLSTLDGADAAVVGWVSTGTERARPGGLNTRFYHHL